MTTPEVPGFDRAPFTHGGRTHQMYRGGAGPAVVVIHEIPGVHPGMVSFARRLVEGGYTVYLPSLFGRPGQPASTGAVLRSILRVCVSREFAILADRTSPGRDLAAGAGGQGLQRVRRFRGGRDRRVPHRRVRAGHGGWTQRCWPRWSASPACQPR
jgi:Dienelactone hydrolase family